MCAVKGIMLLLPDRGQDVLVVDGHLGLRMTRVHTGRCSCFKKLVRNCVVAVLESETCTDTCFEQVWWSNLRIGCELSDSSSNLLCE